ncbi:hypothetical protein MM_2544 [Methanosarcina mazei Go1]|uniref:Uncharacterized protein n=1 Tax=Methanosarcina mazei (strain ATCC BAA-159 / DSM 3647 / Goe1 / Go1 / JCM 11833 / OCM 88) TaxID=192952 RepID=Q8PU13_METMA|nr:hypothetical protein MM_2544 [Methanosarcina mazei Go1]
MKVLSSTFIFWACYSKNIMCVFYLFFCESICRKDIRPPDITAVDFRTIDLKFFLQNFSLYFRIIKDNKLI